MTPRNPTRVLAAVTAIFAIGLIAGSQEKQDKAKDIANIPKQVMDALKAKFPKAEIRKWSKEKEGDEVVYDIEFNENGRACEADIRENGTYINYEKSITAKDLPAAVTKAIEAKFPKATLKEIMEETEVKGKEEKLSAYEVVIATADKSFEIRFSPDGKVLEEEVLGTSSEAAKAGAEHEFLKRFVGEWDCETEAFLEPDKPVKSKGTMKGSMVGNFWAIVEVHGDAFGQPYHGQGTFGFDSTKSKKYIGTWADSMSDFMWKYEGTVNGNKLVLHSEGPMPSDPSKPMKTIDTWEFKGADQVVLTGEMLGPDGKMSTMVKVTCTRKK
jgi:hypothetical protein